MTYDEDRMCEVRQKAFELGGLEDGSYHLEDDELEYLIQLALSQQENSKAIPTVQDEREAFEVAPSLPPRVTTLNTKFEEG